jgi:hypothetical protein
MRDPDLVHQAERAAAALEEAWIRWRTRHGLATGALPPVSSYVGYSVEEPWGQPRVVFGIEAAEAERLAAILDDDYAGPLTGLTGAPERRTGTPECRTSAPERPGRDTVTPAWTVPSPAPGGSTQSFGPGRLAVPAGRPADAPGPATSPKEQPHGPGPRPGGFADQPGALTFRPGTPADQPGVPAGRAGVPAELASSAQRVSGAPGQAPEPAERADTPAQPPESPALRPDVLAEPSVLSAPGHAVAPKPETGLPALGQPSNGVGPSAAQLRPPGQPAAGAPSQSAPGQPAAGAASQSAAGPASAGAAPPGTVPVWAPAPDRAGPRPGSVTPVGSPLASRESAPFALAAAPAEADIDYGRAEELTTEQPILPRALRRAAALADTPAELPDHEAAYLQELAARPGIVALRPRSGRPETAPVAGEQPAASPWPSATYPSRPAPLLGQPAADERAADEGTADEGTAAEPVADDPAAKREVRAGLVAPGPAGLVAAIGRGTPAGSGAPSPGLARAAAVPTGTQPTPADGVPVTRLLPVSRLNRTRKPSEPGSWPAVGGQAHPTDTAV